MFPNRKFSVQTCPFFLHKNQPKMSLLLLILLGNIVVSYSDVKLFRTKRADIDLQTCIDNFDIHRDKIIRTQDSQNMGAKYLNEIDLGSREECLRLCCETENCDVFVFDEKNSGSCYLFHCGPPEDFKCKFTHHVNYSSAVLAINRHLPDLESQIKLTKHEQDLSKLRKSDVEVMPPSDLHTSTSSTTVTSKTKNIEIKTKSPEKSRKCSRYQFECRSTSECIAIYNACDGIPQCADGSDEAPELGCPDSLTTPLPVSVHLNNPVQPPSYDNNVAPQQIHPLIPVQSQPEIYRPPGSLAALSPPQVPSVARQEQDFIRPLPNSRDINLQLPFENQQIAQFGPGPVAANNWMGQPNHAMVPPIPQYLDKNSHIFNHKGNGLQVPDGQEISQMQYMDGREQYGPKVQNYYESYRQPIQQEAWPGNAEEMQYNGYSQDRISNKVWHQDNLQNNLGKNANFKATYPDQTFESKKIPSQEQEKMAHELKHSKETTPQKAPVHETKIKIETHQHPHSNPYPDVVTYQMERSDIEDGIAETASGAVLSLALGLILTCIMALLIGCRLRVRRRMRKSGKSYAHDADYLVNGMYL